MSSEIKIPLDLKHQTIPEIHLNGSSFQGIDFSGLHCDKFFMTSCRHHNTASISGASLVKAVIQDCIFNRNVDLSRSDVKEIYISRTDFEKVLDCSELHVTEAITLRSVNYGIPPNFIDMHLSAAAQNNGDRETFRQIKHSFEAIANRIQANRFFALEMEAYLRELRSRKCKMSKERVLVEIDHAVSRHGQNYIRPFVGLLLVGLVNMFLITFKEKWHLPEVLSDSTLFQILSALGSYLNDFARGLSIFKVLMHDGMEFVSLVLALLMSMFVWHFLVAIRRYTRR